MRTLLLGSDFVYDRDGNLIPIEINTNVGMDDVVIEDEIFNMSVLSDFITSNGFTQVTYIGGIFPLEIKLKELCLALGIGYEFKRTRGSKTIPEVEDSPTHLIIRSAYDINAIVDYTYCRHKVNFMNLIKPKTFGTEFAYRDIDGTLVSTITTIDDNGNHPNFILKAILPTYDKAVYPKLYKVTNQAELDAVLQTVNPMTFLMKYHFNPNKTCQNHTYIIRSLNLLFPPDLQSIPIGQYTRLSTRNIDELSTFDSATYELNYDDRRKYLTGDQLIRQPKLLDTDLVEMADGTFKTALDLQIGDSVKSVKIPNPQGVNIDNELTNYHISYDEFVSGSSYVVNTVIGKERVDKLVDYVIVKFTDGTDWEDTANSTYLSLRTNEVRFLYLYNLSSPYALQKGEQVVLVDTATYPEFKTVLKTVDDVIISKKVFGGWEIGVEGEHVFLTKTDGESSQSYAAIEHNYACTGTYPNCSGTCPKGQMCMAPSFYWCGCYINKV